MVETKFIDENEEGEVLEVYKAVIVHNDKERQEALTKFPNYCREVLWDMGSHRRPQSVLLFTMK